MGNAPPNLGDRWQPDGRGTPGWRAEASPSGGKRSGGKRSARLMRKPSRRGPPKTTFGRVPLGFCKCCVEADGRLIRKKSVVFESQLADAGCLLYAFGLMLPMAQWEPARKHARRRSGMSNAMRHGLLRPAVGHAGRV